MKNSKILYSIIFPVIFFAGLSFSPCEKPDGNDKVLQDKAVQYKDGSFEGMSQAFYENEPFWGIMRLKIENGEFSKVSFMIRDSNLHETFNSRYKKHFEGNPLYLEQCRKDSKGVKKYAKRLSKTGDLEKVDVITGATWSYNIFRASTEEALKNAQY